MGESFDTYRDRFMDRHENAATGVLSTVGSVVMVGGLVTGIVTRRLTLGAVGLAIGTVIAGAAHLFPPTSLREEILAIVRHPVWAVRAESQRIFGGGA
jgi:hypothetical protein